MVAEVIKELSKKSFDDGDKGICCSFFPIDDTWGAKLYYNENTRDVCYDNQEIGLRFDIAPRLGDKFEFKMGYRMVYGFITELAEVAGMLVCDYLDIPRMGYSELVRKDYLEKFCEIDTALADFSIVPEIRKQHNCLMDIINHELINPDNDRRTKEFFMDCKCDLHIFNWGIIEGRPVLVDFSFG
jgi:hypothetical protein